MVQHCESIVINVDDINFVMAGHVHEFNFQHGPHDKWQTHLFPNAKYMTLAWSDAPLPPPPNLGLVINFVCPCPPLPMITHTSPVATTILCQ